MFLRQGKALDGGCVIIEATTTAVIARVAKLLDAEGARARGFGAETDVVGTVERTHHGGMREPIRPALTSFATPPPWDSARSHPLPIGGKLSRELFDRSTLREEYGRAGLSRALLTPISTCELYATTERRHSSVVDERFERLI